MKTVKKEERYDKIHDIITRQVIETQEDLTNALRRQGIEVTQATVSRDIKELMLVKVPMGQGRYRYAYPAGHETKEAVFSSSRMERLFRDTVLGMDYSENLIVVKTMPGAANAVASAIDYAKWPQVIGTIAGDDNILVIVKPKKAVPEVLDLLANMTYGSGER